MDAINLTSLSKQVGMGFVWGIGNFTCRTLVQTICLIFGLKIEEILDEDDVLPHEVFDKDFAPEVIVFPLVGELLFQRALQPGIAFIVRRYLINEAEISQSPRSLLGRVSKALGIPADKVIAAIGVGALSGLIDYYGYEKGAAVGAFLTFCSRTGYGLMKEKYGMPLVITGSIVQKFWTAWFNKYYPN